MPILALLIIIAVAIIAILGIVRNSVSHMGIAILVLCGLFILLLAGGMNLIKP